MIQAELKNEPPKINHFDFLYAQNGNPAKFLGAFLAMRMGKYRKLIVWDAEMLEWTARVWNEAAIAAAGKTRIRDACLKEAERYTFLVKKLFHDERNGPPGQGIIPAVIIFDREDDWPPVAVVKSAIKALEQAQIKIV